METFTETLLIFVTAQKQGSFWYPLTNKGYYSDTMKSGWLAWDAVIIKIRDLYLQSFKGCYFAELWFLRNTRGKEWKYVIAEFVGAAGLHIFVLYEIPQI